MCYLLSECVTLFLTGSELFLPALNISRGLLQSVHQPGVILSQGLQLCFPLLGVGVAAEHETCREREREIQEAYYKWKETFRQVSADVLSTDLRFNPATSLQS